MRKVDVFTRDINERELFRCAAREEDAEILVDEPGMFYLDGKPFLLYDILKSDPSDIEEVLPTFPFKKDLRSGGLKTNSTIFGYMPRIPLRQNYASSTAFAVNHRESHNRVIKRADEIEELFKQYFPEEYRRQRLWVESNILPDWRIRNTVFTSGIVNSNNQLHYHYDSGNMPGSYACMLSYVKNLEAGHLVFPSLNVKFKLKNNSFMLFNNYKCLHGVSPMNFNDEGYRYTVVYYTLRDLKIARSIDEELKRARTVMQKIHKKRAGII